MPIPHRLSGWFLVLLAPACVQAAPPTLNLKLPADAVPAQSPAAAPAPTAVPGQTATADATPNPSASAGTEAPRPLPPPYVADPDATGAQAGAPPACDDKTYGEPQVHGSIGMGIVAGSHLSGNYQSGTVQVTKALGTCDDPTGFVGLSISVGQGNFNHRHRGRRWGGWGR